LLTSSNCRRSSPTRGRSPRSGATACSQARRYSARRPRTDRTSTSCPCTRSHHRRLPCRFHPRRRIASFPRRRPSWRRRPFPRDPLSRARRRVRPRLPPHPPRPLRHPPLGLRWAPARRHPHRAKTDYRDLRSPSRRQGPTTRIAATRSSRAGKQSASVSRWLSASWGLGFVHEARPVPSDKLQAKAPTNDEAAATMSRPRKQRRRPTPAPGDLHPLPEFGLPMTRPAGRRAFRRAFASGT
jgi:hypothetical protein